MEDVSSYIKTVKIKDSMYYIFKTKHRTIGSIHDFYYAMDRYKNILPFGFGCLGTLIKALKE